MDRSNEAQQLKAKLLSVVRSRNLAYIYAATTAISDQTHTRTRVSQSRTFPFRSGCSVCSARGLLVITRSFTRSSHRFRHSMLSLFVCAGHAGGRRSGSAVADVLRLVVPRRARHHQDRREGGRAAGPAHGRLPAPAPLPRLLRAGKSSSMLIAMLGSACAMAVRVYKSL